MTLCSSCCSWRLTDTFQVARGGVRVLCVSVVAVDAVAYLLEEEVLSSVDVLNLYEMRAEMVLLCGAQGAFSVMCYRRLGAKGFLKEAQMSQRAAQ